MASFCGSCGFPLGPNVAFCPQCGAKQSAAAVTPTPVPPISAPVAAKSGSGLKILLVVVAFFGILGLVLVGGLYYAVHKVKQTVVEKAQSYGVDLPDISSSSSVAKKVRLLKPCEYLSKQEAGDLLGEPVERTTVDDVSCMYFGPAGLSQELAQEQLSSLGRRAQTNGAPDINSALNQLAGSLGATTGQTPNGGEVPLLILAIAGDGKAQMTALMANKALFGGIGKNASEGKAGFGEDITGLGDRAVRMAPLGLNVLQGEIIVRVIPGPVPNGDAKGLEIARAVLKKL